MIVAVVAVVIVAALLRGTLGAARDARPDARGRPRRVEDGDYSIRIGKTRSDLPPIQELARGFDTMAARLQADEEQRRSLLADVSHELRTPLAIITGNLEAIARRGLPGRTRRTSPRSSTRRASSSGSSTTCGPSRSPRPACCRSTRSRPTRTC